MDESRLCDIRDEMADVFSYLLALANALNVDLSQALADKIQKNKMKYPKDRFQGRYAPLDPDLPD
jgi:NTP pyrophosphatase (non-canonical NTP hydrolase)